MSGDQKKLIRHYNDELRISGEGGEIVATAAFNALSKEIQQEALHKIREPFVFTDGGNDPYEEGDFGEVTAGGYKMFWKIDYYDKSMDHGSEDPSDPEQTTRVMTIMLSEEY